MKSIVISRFEENLDWINGLDRDIKVHIIDKKLENIGRESYGYLQFIVKNYDSLEGDYTFCQGNPLPHCSQFVYKVNKGTLLSFYSLADNYITNNVNGQPNHNPPLKGKEIVDKIGIKVSDSIYFPTGGQFTVKAEVIKQKPLEFYKTCLEIHKDYEDAPWVFERIWHIIFDFPKKDITYFALGCGVGDSLISISSIHHLSKNIDRFGVILFPNQNFFKKEELQKLCKLNLPNLTDIIQLEQEDFCHLVKFFWPNYSFCKPRGWERLVEEISFCSGIKKDNIFPVGPRSDYFQSKLHISHNSNFKAPVKDYILFNPVSFQSMNINQLYVNWFEILQELSKCKYPVIVISQDKIDINLSNIINLTGQTTLFDTYALADKAIFTVTTGNNLCCYCHFNDLSHFVLGNKVLDDKATFFRKWIQNDNDYILFTYESIMTFKLKFSKAINKLNLGKIFPSQCDCCKIWA